MLAYYLIRPVREALILDAWLAPNCAAMPSAVQALLLILIIPLYSALIRRADPSRMYRCVHAFFVVQPAHLLPAGARPDLHFGFAFFVWTSIFCVMAGDPVLGLCHGSLQHELRPAAIRNHRGRRVGRAPGSARASRSSAFEVYRPLWLDARIRLCILDGGHRPERARARLRAWDRSAAQPGNPAQESADDQRQGGACRWLGGFVVIGRCRYLVGIAALVVLINWITS